MTQSPSSSDLDLPLLFGVSAPGTATGFLSGQLSYLTQQGFKTHLIAPDDAEGHVAALAQREGARYYPTSVSREPSVRRDLCTFRQVLMIVRHVRPSIIVAGTPKMSLLLLMAGFLGGVRHRIYLCHGLRFEGVSGFHRSLLARLERLLVSLSTSTIAVSPSVRERLIEVGVSSDKVSVLGAGSANGVDLSRFATTLERVARARAECQVADGMQAAAFVGRLTHDKGLRALLACAHALPAVTFLVAGHREPRGSDDSEVICQLEKLDNVRLLGRIADVENVYWASNVLLLPTVREGMPTVVLEAAAAGRPTVAFEATGTVDAVIDNETGLLVPQGDDVAFTRATVRLLTDPELMSTMGEKARDRIMCLFDDRTVWEHWSTYLRQLS